MWGFIIVAGFTAMPKSIIIAALVLRNQDPLERKIVMLQSAKTAGHLRSVFCGPSSAPRARSMSAFFNATDRSSIELSVIGAEANWSTGLFGYRRPDRGLLPVIMLTSLDQFLHSG